MSNKIALVSLDFAGFHEKGQSRTRHGATSVRGNDTAQCREPDQPDRSTRLSGHFLSLLPAGACASRGVAVVAAMMPHDLEGGFYEALRHSTNDSVFGFATNRPCRGSAGKPQRQRR